MGQFITIGEAVIVSAISLVGYVLIKTIIQQIKSK
jgi:hypothetical protein